MQGFTTLAGLVPAFAFHAITSVTGLQLVRRAPEPVLSAASAEE
jgi:hypothetical protein